MSWSTWATMERHSLRSCAISTRSTNRKSPGMSSIRLAEYLIRGLPLARVPSILPSSASFKNISIQVLNQPNWSYSVFKCGHSQQIWGIWASGETLNFKYKFKVGNPPDIQNICLSFIRILSYESKSLF